MAKRRTEPPPCPRTELHHPDKPGGYSYHAWWLERASVVCRQEQCPGCGTWAIFIPREPGQAICRVCHATHEDPQPGGGPCTGELVAWETLLAELEAEDGLPFVFYAPERE
jgi:hypothetical protein